MTVTSISRWRLPGCDSECSPRSHNPLSHELYGYQRALAESPLRIVRTGPLVVDLNARTVAVDGAVVLVVGREWALLAYLAERIGRWCPMDEIVAEVWGPAWVSGAPYGKGCLAEGPNALRTTMARLRTRLGAAGRLLTNISSRTCPVRRLELEAPL